MKFAGFLRSSKGINTVEIIILLAIVIGIAIIFREKIIEFVNRLLDSIFNNPDIPGISTTP